MSAEVIPISRKLAVWIVVRVKCRSCGHACLFPTPVDKREDLDRLACEACGAATAAVTHVMAMYEGSDEVDRDEWWTRLQYEAIRVTRGLP